MALDIQLDREYIRDEIPEAVTARRRRIIAILRKYRHYLLTPAQSSPKMELTIISKEGEGHD